MRIKRTCSGCKALRFLQDMGCSLGYNNKDPNNSQLGIRVCAPQEPCPKPKTYKEFIQLTKSSGYYPNH